MTFSYASYGVAGLATLTAVFAAGYGMGVATRIITGLLRLALLLALVGGLCWAAWTLWQRHVEHGAPPSKSVRAAARPAR